MDGRRRRVRLLGSIAMLLFGLSPSASAEPEPLPPLTQQAATFAVRAIADAGLLDPLGDYYHYWNIHEYEGTFVVAFVANYCYNDGQVETCEPYQGRDESLSPDSWLEIGQGDGSFVITETFGRFSDEDSAELIGDSASSEIEAGHAEYPTVRLDAEGNKLLLRAAGLWAGDITEPTWSLCLPVFLDATGTEVWRDDLAIADRPRGESSRSGWLFLMEAKKVDGAVDGEMECEVFSGETWRAKKKPTVQKVGKHRVVVLAKLRWVLDMRVVGLKSRCDVTVRNATGEVIRETTEAGPYSPWVGSQLDDVLTFTEWVKVAKPAKVASADVYCHEL